MCSHLFFLCLTSCLFTGRSLFHTSSRVTFPSLKVCWSLDRDNTKCMARAMKNWCLAPSFLLCHRVQVSCIFVIYLFSLWLQLASVWKLCLWDVPAWRNENDFYLATFFFFLFLFVNSFGHRCSLCKLKVCTVWSEPILPTHYVRYSSACLLVWPRIICTMLSGSRFWHCPCLLPDLRDRAPNILSSRIMCVIWFL